MAQNLRKMGHKITELSSTFNDEIVLVFKQKN